MADIVPVVLASGRAERFNGEKLVADVKGRPLIKWTVDAIRDSQVLEPCLIVCVDRSATGQWVRRSGYELVSGEDTMGGSLRAGVNAADKRGNAVVVCLADQPIPPGIYRALVQQFQVNCVVPRYRGVRGNPVLFPSEWFRDLSTIEGDVGARGLIERGKRPVDYLDLDMETPPDMDRPADLARVAAYVASWSGV